MQIIQNISCDSAILSMENMCPQISSNALQKETLRYGKAPDCQTGETPALGHNPALYEASCDKRLPLLGVC